MKSYLSKFLAFVAVLAGTSTVFAQSIYTGTGTSGMFGYRVIGGAPLGVATQSMFGNRFIGPSINTYGFGVQNATGTAFRYSVPAPYTTSYVPPISVVAPTTAGMVENVAVEPQPPMTVEQPVVVPEAYPQPYPEPYPVPYPVPNPVPSGTNSTNRANGTNTNQGMTPAPATAVPPTPVAPSGIGTPGMTGAPYPRGWRYAMNPARNRQGEAAPSPELSRRITQIARDRDMLAGQRIEVLMDGDTAIIEGTVYNSADGNVLANVLSLEPRVRYIDNRLTTEESTANSRNTRTARRP